MIGVLKLKEVILGSHNQLILLDFNFKFISIYMISEFLTQQDISKQVIDKDNWGAYVVIDDFLKQSYFDNLCSEYNKLKSDESIFTQENFGNVWRQDEENGKVSLIGSTGEKLTGFDKITQKSPVWDDFLSVIYSQSSCFK